MISHSHLALPKISLLDLKYFIKCSNIEQTLCKHDAVRVTGQEIVAEQAMDLAAKEGQWVVLQNVHLVAKWLATLEKKIEQYSLDSHEDYR